MCELLTDSLADHGYSIEVAATAESGAALAAPSPFQLILVMPGGLEHRDQALARDLQRFRKGAAVVLLAGYRDDVHHSLAELTSWTLRMPFSREDLLEAVGAVLQTGSVPC